MTKKKIVACLVAMAIAGIAFTNVRINAKKNGVYDLALVNTEALAQGEIKVEMCVHMTEEFCEFDYDPDDQYIYIYFPARKIGL